MTGTIRKAIESSDSTALHALVTSDPQLADADVVFGEDGKNRVPPLHYVCDVVFRKLATQDEGLAMANVLLEAGVDVDRHYAKSGDTFLIAAASLGAERVGLRLVELGADVTRRGLFGATALHWAAFMGLDELAAPLVEARSEIELRDTRYDRTPLQWALYGWTDGPIGRRAGIPSVLRTLVQRGAQVAPDVIDRFVSAADKGKRPTAYSCTLLLCLGSAVNDGPHGNHRHSAAPLIA